MKKLSDIEALVEKRVQEALRAAASIPWRRVLKEIASHTERARQLRKDEDCSTYFLECRVKELQQVEALVEMLEEILCGSHGGFDRGQSDRSLSGRIAWLTTHKPS